MRNASTMTSSDGWLRWMRYELRKGVNGVIDRVPARQKMRRFREDFVEHNCTYIEPNSAWYPPPARSFSQLFQLMHHESLLLIPVV